MNRPAEFIQSLNIQRPTVIAALMVVLIIAGLAVVFNTDLFYVYDLNLAGTKYLTAAEIQKASGIMSYNIFFVDAREVQRALERMPEIKTARVGTSLPNQVSVTIVERKPEIVWQRGSETYWVDLDSVAFRARTNLPELPTIRDLDNAPVKPGQRVNLDAVNAFWAFRAAYIDGPRAVEWSAGRGLAFTDERGWKIYLGDANEMAGKVAKLRALVPQLVAQNAKIKFIDVGRGEPYYQ